MTVRIRILIAAVGVFLGLMAAQSQPASSAGRPLDVSGTVRLQPGGGAVMHQRGSFSGSPLGSGSIALSTRVGTGSGATFTFDLSNGRGSVHGSGNVSLAFPGTMITYKGSAKITSGSGAFKNMRASNLKVTGSGQLSGETFKVRLTGTVTG
jgi:hypothetical protein